MHRLIAILLSVAATTTAVGCGGGRHKTAPVSGMVYYDGKPVSGGTITFSPIGEGDADLESGKAAVGTIGKDGTFVLSTYETDDGAIIGKHRIFYSPPEAEESENQADPTGEEETASKAPSEPSAKEAQLQNLVVDPAKSTVEITVDGNNIKVVLVPQDTGEESEEEND